MVYNFSSSNSTQAKRLMAFKMDRSLIRFLSRCSYQDVDLSWLLNKFLVTQLNGRTNQVQCPIRMDDVRIPHPENNYYCSSPPSAAVEPSFILLYASSQTACTNMSHPLYLFSSSFLIP